MITTPDLIESLVARAAPVRRLAPLARAAGWLLFAALLFALMAIGREARPDLALRFSQPVFVTGFAGSLATGVLAAIAAFLVSVPGRSRAWLLLPLPALLVWMATVGYGCLAGWVSLAPGSSPLVEESGCFALLILTGMPLSALMLFMLRHAARTAPTPVGILGGLAVAGLTAAALSIFHAHDASVIILVWNIGTALLLVALGGLFGRRMLSWVAPG
jgi:hypothetical protein